MLWDGVWLRSLLWSLLGLAFLSRGSLHRQEEEVHFPSEEELLVRELTQIKNAALIRVSSQTGPPPPPAPNKTFAIFEALFFKLNIFGIFEALMVFDINVLIHL